MPRSRRKTETSPTPSASQTKDNESSRLFIKCSKCNKLGRKSCSQQACFSCCTDVNCEGHREHREKQSIIEGEHPLQQLANVQRAKTIKKGLFRDGAFRFLGETVQIWNLNEYLKNPKWKDEAIRKSRRYVQRGSLSTIHNSGNKRKRGGVTIVVDKTDKDTIANELEKSLPMGIRGRQKRFKAVMDNLYQKSLE